MSRDKSVVFAFPRAWEPGDASQHAKPVESFPAPGKDLVRITLVSHVPDKFIAGCSKHLMQRNRQFNGTEIGGKMPSGFGDGVIFFPRTRLKIASILNVNSSILNGLVI